MALNSNEKAFVFNVEERMNKVGSVSSPAEDQEYTDTPTPTRKNKKNKMRATPSLPSQREKFASAHMPRTKNGERKSERLQLTVRPSTKSRLAKYAEHNNTSSNEIVQILLDAFLDEQGY